MPPARARPGGAPGRSGRRAPGRGGRGPAAGGRRPLPHARRVAGRHRGEPREGRAGRGAGAPPGASPGRALRARRGVRGRRPDAVGGPSADGREFRAFVAVWLSRPMPRDLPGPLAGVLIDLSVPSEEEEDPDEALDLRSDRAVGVPAWEWLRSASAAELAWVLDEFGGLHDPLVAERLAQAVLCHGRACGPRGASRRQLAQLWERLGPELELEHPHLRLGQLLRAVRAFVNQEVPLFEQLLADAFELLEPSGRLAVVTFRSWELAALRRFLRAREPPSEHVAGVLPAAALAELYPLAAARKGFAAQRVGRALTAAQLGQGPKGRDWMLHVVEKAPYDGALDTPSAGPGSPGVPEAPGSRPSGPAGGLCEPPAPEFGVRSEAEAAAAAAAEAEAAGPGAGQSGAGAAAAWQDELDELRAKIAARKLELREEGQSLRLQRKDPRLAELVRRQDAIYRTCCERAKYEERARERCRARCHVPVLLAEATEQLVVPGPGRLYVDCTFGRGGHSSVVLSKLSSEGRLVAFDVDPLAVQVGRALAAEDGRFRMVHAPFSELAGAVREPVGGVLLDLGVSSPQLDDVSRGFSIKGRKDGPLDLRMNQEVGVPAAKWLQGVSAAELAWVIDATCYRLDAALPRRIAEVVLRRGPYESTAQLVAVLDALGAELQLEHPNLNLAHIVFCAIRVFLNREVAELDRVLEGALERLELHGRVVVICFNRWEVAAVRSFLRSNEDAQRAGRRTGARRQAPGAVPTAGQLQAARPARHRGAGTAQRRGAGREPEGEVRDVRPGEGVSPDSGRGRRGELQWAAQGRRGRAGPLPEAVSAAVLRARQNTPSSSPSSSSSSSSSLPSSSSAFLLLFLPPFPRFAALPLPPPTSP
ncbi:unnamed protein product, partial [Prorocentrum cordatum]